MCAIILFYYIMVDCCSPSCIDYTCSHQFNGMSSFFPRLSTTTVELADGEYCNVVFPFFCFSFSFVLQNVLCDRFRVFPRLLLMWLHQVVSNAFGKERRMGKWMHLLQYNWLGYSHWGFSLLKEYCASSQIKYFVLNSWILQHCERWLIYLVSNNQKLARLNWWSRNKFPNFLVGNKYRLSIVICSFESSSWP